MSGRTRGVRTDARTAADLELLDPPGSASLSAYAALVRFRPGALEDFPFLVRMLHEACLWNPEWEKWPIEELMTDAHLRRYVENWGREGDAAVIATDDRGHRVGAAWYRVFPEDEPGFGFADGRTPELSIAVLPEWRGRGAGGGLLRALMETAKAEGFAALSLSVNPDNPAVRLYQRLGFEKVELVEGNWTMIARVQREVTTKRTK